MNRQQLFENQTSHGLNIVKPKKWSVEIDHELEALNSYANEQVNTNRKYAIWIIETRK